MQKNILLVLIIAASLCASDGRVFGAFQAYKGQTLTKKVGKKLSRAVSKVVFPLDWVAKPVRRDNGTLSLRDGVWKQMLRRGATVYLAASLAVLPMCSNFVCGTRDASLVADRLVQERIPEGEANNLVVFSNGEGEQKFGVARDSWLVFMPNDADYRAVAPLTARRGDIVPFVDADGFHSADGWWQVINWDLFPDALLARRVDRAKVIDVSIVQEIAAKVRIETESAVMIGRGIVKLADKNSDLELYAVRIDSRFATEASADSDPALLVEQDIEPYFTFLTAAEFEVAKAAAQE